MMLNFASPFSQRRLEVAGVHQQPTPQNPGVGGPPKGCPSARSTWQMGGYGPRAQGPGIEVTIFPCRAL